jgi:hypothetical protein
MGFAYVTWTCVVSSLFTLSFPSFAEISLRSAGNLSPTSCVVQQGADGNKCDISIDPEIRYGIFTWLHVLAVIS